MAAPERRVGTGHFIIFILPLYETLEPARVPCVSLAKPSLILRRCSFGPPRRPLLAPFSFELVRPVQPIIHGNPPRSLGLGRGDDAGPPTPFECRGPRLVCEPLQQSRARRRRRFYVSPRARAPGPRPARPRRGRPSSCRDGGAGGGARGGRAWPRRPQRGGGARAARDSLDSLAARISSMRGPLAQSSEGPVGLALRLARAARLCLRADADAYVLGGTVLGEPPPQIAALSSPSKATPRSPRIRRLNPCGRRSPVDRGAGGRSPGAPGSHLPIRRGAGPASSWAALALALVLRPRARCGAASPRAPWRRRSLARRCSAMRFLLSAPDDVRLRRRGGGGVMFCSSHSLCALTVFVGHGDHYSGRAVCAALLVCP